MQTLEEAYQALAESVLDFIRNRQWDSGVIQCWFGDNMVRLNWYCMLSDEKIENAIDWPSSGLRDNEAALFLRQHLLEHTGDLIWGLTFTLYPDGKFNIEYDYQQPAIDDIDELPTEDAQQAEAVEVRAEPPSLQFFQACRKELELKTSIAEQAWGLGRVTSWEIDQMFGMLTFHIDGELVFREVDIVGTYNSSNQTFMWAWDNPSVDEDLQEVAGLVREYGTAHGIAALTTHHLKCSEDDAWNFAAVACHLAEAEGAYRGEFEGGWVYVVFREERDEA